MFEIGVAADADLAAVRDRAGCAVAELPFTLSAPEPMVWIERIGDGAVILTVTGWIDQTTTAFPTARGEAIRVVKGAIEGMGVEVPDTTYRVQLLGAGAARVAEMSGLPGAAPSPRPSESRPPAGPISEAAPLRTERALERIIAAERGDGAKPDLLDARAPEE